MIIYYPPMFLCICHFEGEVVSGNILNKRELTEHVLVRAFPCSNYLLLSTAPTVSASKTRKRLRLYIVT